SAKEGRAPALYRWPRRVEQAAGWAPPGRRKIPVFARISASRYCKIPPPAIDIGAWSVEGTNRPRGRMDTPSSVLVRGTGSYLPPAVMGNEDFVATLDTSDEWIRERTGIRERR